MGGGLFYCLQQSIKPALCGRLELEIQSEHAYTD